MNSTAIRVGWTLVALGLAAIRLSGEKGQIFQAVAHLCVGGWFAAWAVLIAVWHRYTIPTRPGWYGWLSLVTSLVEVYAFLAGRHS